MQDNVTQEPKAIYLQPDCCAPLSYEGRQWCEDAVWEECDCDEPKPIVRYIRADLASTAQPEVKALVEALEAIKAQTSAEDDAGKNYRWDDREGALDFAYATAAQALAAYHEAQP